MNCKLTDASTVSGRHMTIPRSFQAQLLDSRRISAHDTQFVLPIPPRIAVHLYPADAGYLEQADRLIHRPFYENGTHEYSFQ